MTRRVKFGLLALLFMAVPLLEIYVIIQIGQVIGAWWTILLLVADGVLGAYLIRHEGGRAWRALRQALDERRMPARELADGALILVGGALMVTPGFVTDLVGLFCVLPMTRPLARRVMTRLVTRSFLAVSVTGTSPGGGTRTRQRPGPDSVVQGDVVD